MTPNDKQLILAIVKTIIAEIGKIEPDYDLVEKLEKILSDQIETIVINTKNKTK